MNRDHKRLVDRLESSAQDLAAYLAKFSENDLFGPPAPNEWSVHQLAAHLRDTEVHVFLYRLKRILSEDNLAVQDFDQEAWHREHYSASEPLKKIVADFRATRRKQIALLRKTRDKDWSRRARHSAYGTISLEWLVNRNVNHTFEHVSQIGFAHANSLLKKLND